MSQPRPAPALSVTDEGAASVRIHGDQRVQIRSQRWALPGGLVATRSTIDTGRPDAPAAGPPVVLVHGFGQNRYTWHTSHRSLSAFLAAEGCEVFNLELRGHGLSHAAGAPSSFQDYVEDVATFARVLGQPAFWMGHSLGGAVVYAAATRTPMLGIIGLAALFRFAQANRLLKLLCQISRVAADGPAASVKLRLAGRLLARLYSLSDIAGYAFPISGWAPGSIEEDLLHERLEHGFDKISLPIWSDMSRWGAEGRFDYEEEWAAVKTPLLVLAGDLDHLVLPADAKMAYDLEGGTDKTFHSFDVYNTGYHWGHLDLVIGHQARRFVWKMIGEWIGRIAEK